MNPEVRTLALKVVEYVTKHTWRESILLSPNPSLHMSDPYGLLRLLEEEGLTQDEIDTAMVSAQEGK